MPAEICGRQLTTTCVQPAILKLIQANKLAWGVSDKQFNEYLSCLQAYQASSWGGAAEVHPVSQGIIHTPLLPSNHLPPLPPGKINCVSSQTGFSMMHHAVLNQHDDIARLLINLRSQGFLGVDFNVKSSRQAPIASRDKTPVQLLTGSVKTGRRRNPVIKEMLTAMIDQQGMAEADFADDIVELETMESLGGLRSKFVGQQKVIKGSFMCR